MQKEIVVNQKVYPLEVIYQTAYIYIDRCYVLLSRPEKDQIAVRLKAKPECPKATFDALVGEFENELLAQVLRRKVAMRTEGAREAIIHRALFSAMPESLDLALGDDDDDGDYLDDPLGIAVPWEEKFGQEKDK
jgi:His-Xaa-Ser system protein HxsD